MTYRYKQGTARFASLAVSEAIYFVQTPAICSYKRAMTVIIAVAKR